MHRFVLSLIVASGIAGSGLAQDAKIVAKPKAFPTLVNPMCSHCRDEAKRRAGDLRPEDRVLCWIRGYSEGGAIPHRFFLNEYRVISDTYGVFVFDPDAGYSRGFAPSLDFTFHGWRNGVMTMRHQDGTLFSCLTGVAFDGPRKGERLKAVPTLTSDWGHWLDTYPQAVAYHMFEKYQAVEVPAVANQESLATRLAVDARMPAETMVLGLAVGGDVRAYRIEDLAKRKLLTDEVDAKPAVILWLEKTRTAAAYRPIASPPKKVQAKPRSITLEHDGKVAAAPFRDQETGSRWDIAGRAVEGDLKNWTLEWLDGVQVKWFAWSAEYPATTIHDPTKATKSANAKDLTKEIAGTAEFLKAVPKRFGIVQQVDQASRQVTLKLDGESATKAWKLTDDAEVKIRGAWGRLSQLETGRKVWCWFRMGRSKEPTAIFMLADELSEQDIHGGAEVKNLEGKLVLVGPKKKEQALDDVKSAKLDRGEEKCCELAELKSKDVVFVETKDGKIERVYNSVGFEALRRQQRAWLREQWIKEGLPASVGVLHVYSGEVDILIDHEAMRWARSLTKGDAVELALSPSRRGVVKSVQPQREKTQIRLVVHSLDLAELAMGQRIALKMPAPPSTVEDSLFPPDIDRPRGKEDRVEWILANIYCTCGVANDTCTGHFYTLASCNPNGCAAPNSTRKYVAGKIDAGWNDRQIFEALRKERGPLMLRPHLLP